MGIIIAVTFNIEGSLSQPTGAVALSGAQTPDGSGRIFLDNVECVGTEARLSACPANPVGIHNCVHGDDAGVICQPCMK